MTGDIEITATSSTEKKYLLQELNVAFCEYSLHQRMKVQLMLLEEHHLKIKCNSSVFHQSLHFHCLISGKHLGKTKSLHLLVI